MSECWQATRKFPGQEGGRFVKIGQFNTVKNTTKRDPTVKHFGVFSTGDS